METSTSEGSGGGGIGKTAPASKPLIQMPSVLPQRPPGKNKPVVYRSVPTRIVTVDASDFKSAVWQYTGFASDDIADASSTMLPGTPYHVSTQEDQELKVVPMTPYQKNMDSNSLSLIDMSEDDLGTAGIFRQDLPNALDFAKSTRLLDSDRLLKGSTMKKMNEGLSKDRIPKIFQDCSSIFFLLPREYEFERETLIQLWMAGGYVMDELMGYEYFHYLLSEEYLSCSGTNFVTRKDRYRINIKKIKDLLDCQRDNGNFYLKWESECQEITKSTKIQHVSLVCNDIDASIFQTLQQFSELRTLLFLREYGDKVTQIPYYFFQSCKKLQALDLSRTHIKKLPSSVGCMSRLCCLDLSWTLIEWLPDIVCSLEELQVLKLMGCSKLRGLPRQLKKLTKLRHLEVDVLRQLATIPRGIGALVNLRTLPAFLVGTEDGCKIQELKAINNLTGDFCIAMLENVGNVEEAKEATLNKKQHLNKLELRWTASQFSRTDYNCYAVLDNLQPCSHLEELRIFCYEGSTFPDWIGDPKFCNLISITFFKCEHVSELPLVEQLPFLKQLELVKMNGVKKIEHRGNSEQAAFFSLEKLQVDEMQSLRSWNWTITNDNDFKNLVELTINDCPQLDEFHVLACLSSVKHLEIRECPKLESLSKTKLPYSLEDLIVEDCPIIKKKRSQRGGEDWYKIQHVSNIRICVDDDEDEDEC